MRATDNPDDRPTCECGRPVRTEKSRDVRYWRKKCTRCLYPDRDHTAHGRRPHRKLVAGKRCAICGFRPVDTCQMDVHHKDGDRTNNDLSNVLIVCANCHRLIHRRGTKRGSY